MYGGYRSMYNYYPQSHLDCHMPKKHTRSTVYLNDTENCGPEVFTAMALLFVVLLLF
jgi:hypothetical protein